MPYRSTQAARRELSALAHTQGGYFTAKQAAVVGYGKRHLDYHVKAGNFERVERGLYKITAFPPSDHDDLIRLSLWSRGRDDKPQAVVSHETALDVYGLGELLPTRIHLTVPRSFRKRPPAGCVLHKAKLTSREIAKWEGFLVTSPIRTLLDIAETDSVTHEQLHRIVEQALANGIVRRTKLVDAVNRQTTVSRISKVLNLSG